MLYLAFGLYLINLGVGLAAQFGQMHFGRAHHWLYFVVFLSAIAAAVLRFHPALLLTLAALALMPKSKPRTWQHPTLAVTGLIGYGLTLAFPELTLWSI